MTLGRAQPGFNGSLEEVGDGTRVTISLQSTPPMTLHLPTRPHLLQLLPSPINGEQAFNNVLWGMLQIQIVAHDANRSAFPWAFSSVNINYLLFS